MTHSRADQPLTPEDILASHPPQLRSLANELRQVIKRAVPEASEAAYPVWHAIGYRHPTSGYFCGIFPQEDSLDLAFEYGVLLPDPQNLLTGRGKQVRYLHLEAGQPVPEEALLGLIEAALSLPDGRQAKQDMLRAASSRGTGSSEPSK